MSRQNRRRKLRKYYADMDSIAKRESTAIQYMKVEGNVQAKRLNKTYMCDGVRFNTGKKHRQGGNW